MRPPRPGAPNLGVRQRRRAGRGAVRVTRRGVAAATT